MLIIFVTMTCYELFIQWMEYREIQTITTDIIKNSGALDNRSRVIAIRDYLRKNVTHLEAPYLDKDRPFLRATALETLKSGKGYCGEVSRAFINMAAAAGIKSQRINLYGEKIHTVAEAELSPVDLVIVDALDTPQIEGLERLDKVILRPEYDDYFTLNLRRLRLNWLIRRIKMEIGPLTYWTENPHLLKATFWGGLVFIMVILKLGRDAIRIILKRRGWVHLSTVDLKIKQVNSIRGIGSASD